MNPPVQESWYIQYNHSNIKYNRNSITYIDLTSKTFITADDTKCSLSYCRIVYIT